MLRHLIQIFVFLLLFSPVGLAQNFWQGLPFASEMGEGFGSDLAYIGDIDGDGTDELAIGASVSSRSGLPASGAVYVVSSSKGIIHSIFGTVAEGRLGIRICAMGDINGDSIPDFLAMRTDPSVADLTIVEAYSGSDATLLYSVSVTDSAIYRSSDHIANVGDTNGDGVDDFVIAAGSGLPSYLNPPARAVGTLFSGATGQQLVPLEIDPDFKIGTGACGLGDLDGDGFADFAVGSLFTPLSLTSNAFNVLIFSGQTGDIINYIRPLITGTLNYDYRGFGTTMVSLADRDGDGLREIAIGSEGCSTVLTVVMGFPVYKFSFGAVWIGNPMSKIATSSSPLAPSQIPIFGSLAFENVGAAIAAFPDVDGDGLEEILVGQDIKYELSSGSYYGAPANAKFFLRPGGGGTHLLFAGGFTDRERYGEGLDASGDFDGDGLNDIAFGAPGADYNGIDSGCVEVLSRGSFGSPSTYTSATNDHTLNLSWSHYRRPTSVQGDILCTGATPGGTGIYTVSLAKAEIALPVGFTLLTAIDSTNLVHLGAIGFGPTGQIQSTYVSRFLPALAGWDLHMQMFEIAPVLQASNGLTIPIEG